MFNYANANVALNKLATQSSIFKGGSATNAVNGNLNDVSMSHTDNNVSEYHI